MATRKISFVEGGEKYWFDPETREYYYQGDIEALAVTLENIRSTATIIESGFEDPSKWDEIDADPTDFTPEKFVYSPDKAQKIILAILERDDKISTIRLSK